MSWQKQLRPAVKRQMVAEVMATHHLSERRACGLIGIYTTTGIGWRLRMIVTGRCGSGCARWRKSGDSGAARACFGFCVAKASQSITSPFSGCTGKKDCHCAGGGDASG
jgi:hypothetical protein